MPVTIINVIPRAVQQILYPGLKKNDWGGSDILLGRYVTLLVSTLIILLVYRWAKLLYGIPAGLFAAFLMAFCPNNLASAGLVTQDTYSVLALLFVMYCTWRFCTVKTFKYFLRLCVAVALAQLVKQTLLYLYLLIPVCVILYWVLGKHQFNVKKMLKYAVYFVVINWFVINAGYYFYQTNTAVGSYHFFSRPFMFLQHALSAWLPIPLPRPFVDGLDMVKHNNDIGGGFKNSTFGNVTILGRSSTGGTFWYYYLVTVFFKTPISYFVFMAYGFWAMVKCRSLKSWRNNEFFLITPVLFFFITMSLLVKIQTGIRHIIFIYPFLFILSAGFIPYVKGLLQKTAVAIACVYLVVSVLIYWRNYYPYTNEFILDKKLAYRYVGDDNLDYNQELIFFKEYLSAHPNVQLATEKPQPGIFLISVPDYMDVWNEKKYAWLTRFKPCGHVAHAGLLITVTKNDLQQ
jgi:4-amino-4-deoxy-L-arabinose transferase-like glycosyltransferase